MPQPESLMREDLEFLGWLNGNFGSHRQILKFMNNHFPRTQKRPVRVLDCATGYGDIPRLVEKWLKTMNIQSEITAVDVNPMTLQIARESSAGTQIHFEIADIFNLPYPQHSFDVVMCNLALHHFSDQDAVKAVRELWRACGHILYVTDITRSDMGLLAAWIVSRFTANPISRHDAVISVKRSFSEKEFQSIALEAGLDNLQHENTRFFRQGIISRRANLITS